MRRILCCLIVGLLTAASCSASSDNEPNLGSEAATTTPVQQATLTAEPHPDEEPPVSGAVGDLENPIHVLEDGTTFDPAWRSDVTLTCGPDPGSRRVAVVQSNTNNRGVPALYRQEPSNGGFATELISVGSVVEADADFVWAIQGILLGPWSVDAVTDTCGDEQANGLVPHAVLAAEQRAGTPVSTDIATTQAEADLLMAERGLDPLELEPGSVLLSFVFSVSSTPECGFGSLIGLRYSQEHATVGPWLGPPPSPDLGPGEDLVCNSDINPFGFVVLVGREDLPDGEFWLSLDPDRRVFPTLDPFLTKVDDVRLSDRPFGDIPVLVAGNGLAVGESGVALHVPTECGRELLSFDVDRGLWSGIADGYELSESWLTATSGNGRINLILTRTSEDELSAVPVQGGDAVTYRSDRGSTFEPCPF